MQRFTSTDAEQANALSSVPRVSTVTPDEIATASRPSTQMLLAISATGKHLYQGTVAPATIARRRAQNKAARAARRTHRKAARR